jgi:hypothetical protein
MDTRQTNMRVQVQAKLAAGQRNARVGLFILFLAISVYGYSRPIEEFRYQADMRIGGGSAWPTGNDFAGALIRDRKEVMTLKSD